VDSGAGLDEVEKRKFLTIRGLELRPLGHPARSQSLYRLCYPGSYRVDYVLLESRYFGGVHFPHALYISEQTVNYRLNRSSSFS
jgi:hypothetical protein